MIGARVGMARSDRTDGALIKWRVANLVQDDVVAAGLQPARGLVHARGPDGAALAAPAKPRAAEASAPAAMVEIAGSFIVVNAPVSVRFSSLAPVLFRRMPLLCRDVSAVSVGRTARTGDQPHVPRPREASHRC